MTSAAREGDQALPGKGEQKGGLFRASKFKTGDFIALVKPHWQKLSDAERQKLLTVPDGVAFITARDGMPNPTSKGNKAEDKARQQETFEQFNRSWGRLQEVHLPMYEWRWGEDLYDDGGFDSLEHFWGYQAVEIDDDELLDTLPKLSRGGSIDQFAIKQLHRFLCDLTEKISDAQTQKLADVKKKKCQFPRNTGEIRLLCQNMQVDVMVMVLKELQGSPYPILYHYIQGCMEKAINNVRLSDGRSETRFNIEKAYTILLQLQESALETLGEWLLVKIDEFKSLAQELLKGGGIENPREAYVLVSDPFTDDKEDKCFTVNTQWLEHLKVSKVDTSPRGNKEQHSSQADETGLQLEWLFGAVISDPVVTRQQAKLSAGLQPYTLEDARNALMDALKAQRACQVACESARSVALEILQHRKYLQDFLKPYPDMYAVRQEDDEGSEDDREVPDNVLLFMLSRELHLATAKIIINNSSSARATSDLTAFSKHMEEITRQTNNLDWEKTCSQYYEPDESFGNPKEKSEGSQAEKAVEEQEIHSLPDRIESKTAAVSNEHQEKSLSTEQWLSEKQVLQDWADWIQMGRDHLKILMHAETFLVRKGGGTCSCTDKEEIAESPDSMEAAAATAKTPQEKLSLSKLTPIRENWRRNLRKQFNKMARPSLQSDKADKELLTELSKEIKAMELLLESGKASLQLLEKHFENVAFHDLHDNLGCVILPLLGQRVLRWAKDESEYFASQAKRDLLHEEQVRTDKKKQKDAKKTKAKERKLEKRAALKAAEKENVPPEEAEEALLEEPTASLWAQEPIQDEQKAKSETGDMSWLLGDADELDYESSGDFIGSQNAFKVVKKKTRRSKEHLPSRGQLCPSTRESDCDNPQEAVLVLPKQMPSSQTSSKKLVRPRPPPV